MSPPERIISLVPSLTELVFWLGCGDRLVGRTRFCVEPAGQVDRLPIVGGTKNPHLDRILAAAPDLVIANKEENRREDVEALRAAGVEVLLTDPNTVDEATSMVEQLGQLLDAPERAARLARETRDALGGPAAELRVFVAVWWNPLMGLGSESYGHDLIERSGAHNVLRDRSRYPEVTLQEVGALAPDVILLPDEPFPFTTEHARSFEGVAPARVLDGKLLWWYGPRMPAAIRELRSLFSETAAARPEPQ